MKSKHVNATISDAISKFISNKGAPKGDLFQKRHHGISIPSKDQPICRYCDGGMALNISYPNDECKAFWYCLDTQCQSEFEQVAFADWYAGLKNKTVKSHFEDVGKSQSEIVAKSLFDQGYVKVGGHDWGNSGTWGTLEGRKAWTGYKGQTMEYWQIPEESK